MIKLELHGAYVGSRFTGNNVVGEMTVVNDVDVEYGEGKSEGTADEKYFATLLTNLAPQPSSARVPVAAAAAAAAASGSVLDPISPDHAAPPSMLVCLLCTLQFPVRSYLCACAGAIPPQLSRLRFLTKLDLTGNNLSGETRSLAVARVPGGVYCLPFFRRVTPPCS